MEALNIASITLELPFKLVYDILAVKTMHFNILNFLLCFIKKITDKGNSKKLFLYAYIAASNVIIDKKKIYLETLKLTTLETCCITG